MPFVFDLRIAMPFVSKAQERKFAEMVKAGTMKNSVYREWLAATPDLKKLPERLEKK
jgi:hypothetical protein